MNPKPVFRIELRADDAKSADEGYRQLRAFLKCALRQWGLRCTSAEQVKPTEVHNDSTL